MDGPRLNLDQLLRQLVDRAEDVIAAQGRLGGLLAANKMIIGDLDLPTVRRLVTWPRRPEADWTKGFLAGLFDAEGSYRQGVLSIVDPSPGTVDRTVRAMHALGFAVSIDVVRDRPKPPRVRLRGGLAEHLRFFQTVDPAVTGKRWFKRASEPSA